MQSGETWLQSQLDNPSISLKAIKRRETNRKSFSSLPKDPLWKLVCTDVLSLMGPAGHPIQHCHPRHISSKNEVLELDCHSEEAIQFVQHFAFIILGSLKPYFPTLKEVRVKRNP